MKRLHFLILIGTLMLGISMLSGCAQQLPPASDQSAPSGQEMPAGGQPPASNQTAKADLTGDWKQYKQATFSFDYPGALSADEDLGSYQNGTGYAIIALNDDKIDDPAMLVSYIRYGNISPDSGMGAQGIADAFLESDNKGTDIMGVLHQATAKGQISTFTTANGYGAAEMPFNITDPQGGDVLRGCAIQVYDPASTVGMKARILGLDGEKVKEARDRFVASLKIWNAP